MVRAVDFWDATAEKYAKSPVGDQEVYKEKLETTQRYFDTDSQVFEFGCGTGTTAIHHAPFVQKIVATDISSNMLEIARRKALEANITNVEFQCSTLEDFKAADASFDVVMAHNILHLLEDPEQAIKLSYRLLKPGGVFVTSTVCLGDSFSYWTILLAIGKFFRKLPYVNALKRETLNRYLADAGFNVDLQWNRKKQAAFIILKKPAD
ncbi:MAG: ubiquinone/menaquinone biosynthesis C-methylase UbiE [Pseudohongiellaceae bacterium]|jgi:ubiquinone/menaquinone biosynthesis C-methylase UbiE